MTCLVSQHVPPRLATPVERFSWDEKRRPIVRSARDLRCISDLVTNSNPSMTDLLLDGSHPDVL